jgi:hypothetical protein
LDGFEGGDFEDLDDIDTALSNKNKAAVNRGPNHATTDEFEDLWGNKQPNGVAK